jgi:16S rRNA (uracil1498-N3)-methyltransferase
MQYLHHHDAGADRLLLAGDDHRYLFRVRRLRQGEEVALRSLNDDLLHRYTIDTIDKRQAHLLRIASESHPVVPARHLHIGWCLIDPKNIEKVLPTLNEMGVAQITFFPCARSQNNFRLDFERMKKILLASMQQCGRTAWMQLNEAPSLSAFVAEYSEAYMLHFSDTPLPSGNADDAMTVVIGCEGGFTDEEVALFFPERIVGLDTPMILRSESAAVTVASKILV